MKIKELWQFPIPRTGGYIGKVQFTHKTKEILLLLDYHDETEKKYNSGILFKSVYAHARATEMFEYSLENLINVSDGSGFVLTYFLLIEYTDSKWLQGLQKNCVEVVRPLNLRHFAIDIEDYGLYEIIAQDYKILETKEGSLAE